MLLAGARWVPDIPESRGKVHLEVDVPEGFEAVTAGRLTVRRNEGTRTLLVWEIDHPLRDSLFPPAPTASSKGVPGIYRPPSTISGKTTLRASPTLTQFPDTSPYIRTSSALPFSQICGGGELPSTGYGFASYTLLGSPVIRLPFMWKRAWVTRWPIRGGETESSWTTGRATGRRDSPPTWPTTSSRSGLPRRKGGEYRRQMLRNYFNLVSPEEDFPWRFYGRESPASRAVGYGKGAMVFHMARRLAGDDAFWKGLRDVYRGKVFKEATWDDFASAFALNSKEDFHAFFRQWVVRPGAPVIGWEDVRAEKSGTGWRVHGAITQEGPLIGSTSGTARVRKEFTTRRLRQRAKVPFVIETKTSSWRLMVDPRVDVFRRLHPGEIPLM